MLDLSNPLLLLALVLVVGVASGDVVKRLHLPSVTGQIIAGIVLGPSIVGVFPDGTADKLSAVTSFALGLMAVTVGNHLQVRRLRNAKRRLGWLLLCEALVTPLVVIGCVLAIPGTRWDVAILLGAIAVSTAPATILAIVKETRSHGVFVKTLVAAVALNNIACISLFEIAKIFARTSYGAEAPGVMELLVAPLRELLASAALGGLAGALLVFGTRKTVRADRLTTTSLVAILLTAGVAEALDLSPLLACMCLGIALANMTPDKDEIGHGVFANFESAVFAVFFTLAGIELHLSALATGGVLALMVFLARALGKLTSARVAMHAAHATEKVRRNLGLALLPQAGLAVGLMLIVTEDPVFEPIADVFLATVLSVVTLNELIGPVLTRLALKRAGELGRDRARLIDFLREENIVVDLDAPDKDDAIRQLTDILIETNHLDANRDELLESVMRRENEISTCVGGGLAVPHGVLPEGEMVGAMGISAKGLDFETPDGKPVHCMVVLATPATQRDRHLEVLAALAKAIGFDPGVKAQLFNAKTSAHAYEVLHAEEAESFNYFMDDDED